MKKRILLSCSLLALAAVLITTVYAYMFHKTGTISNIFTPAKVSCQIVEEFNGTKKKSVQVKNTGNVDAYIRVQLVFHWEDSKGNVVARDVTTTITSYNDTDWIEDDNYIFYYNKVVAPGETTSNLLPNSGIILAPTVEVDNGITYTYYPVVEVLAEAIQSAPVDAENYGWNVIP